MAKAKVYDILIIGGGPAGLTAGLYASRDRLKALVIEKAMFGGQIVNAAEVDNYPGVARGISGFDLGQAMHKHATSFGLETVNAEVTGLEVRGKEKLVTTSVGDYAGRAVIIAGGSERTKLGVPGEAEFVGKGVSYCAVCDAAFFKDEAVAVVGGGNAAIGEAVHLAKIARSVTLIHRRNELRAAKVEQERASKEPRIKFRLESVVEAIEGQDFVSGIKVKNVRTGKTSKLAVAGVFVSIGFKPNTEYLKGVVPLDEGGAVITDGRLQTSVPGVYAAGDIRHDSGRQVIVAAGDGALAAINAERDLAGH